MQVHSHHPITVVPFFLFFFVVAGVLCVPEMVRSASLRRILYTCTLLEKTRLNEDIFVSQFFFFFCSALYFFTAPGKTLGACSKKLRNFAQNDRFGARKSAYFHTRYQLKVPVQENFPQYFINHESFLLFSRFLSHIPVLSSSHKFFRLEPLSPKPRGGHSALFSQGFLSFVNARF